MSNNKHKLKKKRRHDRQIAEGIRIPKESGKRIKVATRREVHLSSIDPKDVRAVLDMVKNLSLL